MTEPTEGQVVANRYVLQRPLGRGGMGSVWVAWHKTLGAEVAVKFIDSEHARKSDVLARFGREAQALAKIKSPHVTNVLDYGTDESGRPYIAMELLQGEDLGARTQRDGPLAVALVAKILDQAGRALTKAHRAGIVHRDIKPENLFLCEDEDEGVQLKLLDFGIAKDSAVRTDRTGTGLLLGTPLFMSPEQALGDRNVDFRTDLYSLGVVAYRCLTGRAPFEVDGLGALIVAITSRRAAPVTAYRPELPAEVDRWFERAMHKDPACRFESAREMAQQFAIACHLSIPSALTSGPVPILDGDTFDRRSGSLPDVEPSGDDDFTTVFRGSLPGVEEEPVPVPRLAASHSLAGSSETLASVPRPGSARVIVALGVAIGVFTAALAIWLIPRSTGMRPAEAPAGSRDAVPIAASSAPLVAPVFPSPSAEPPDSPTAPVSVGSAAPAQQGAPRPQSSQRIPSTKPSGPAAPPVRPVAPPVPAIAPPPKKDAYGL